MQNLAFQSIKDYIKSQLNEGKQEIIDKLSDKRKFKSKPEVLIAAGELDPTASGSYTEWLAEYILKGQIDPSDQSWTSLLALFTDITSRKKEKGTSIMKMTPEDVATFVADPTKKTFRQEKADEKTAELSREQRRKKLDEMGLTVSSTPKFDGCPMIVYNKKQKYGMVNYDTLEIILKPTYDHIRDFTFPDTTAFKEGKLWGIIDNKGNVLIKPIFSSIWQFTTTEGYRGRLEAKKSFFSLIKRDIDSAEGDYKMDAYGNPVSQHFKDQFDRVEFNRTEEGKKWLNDTFLNRG